MVSEDTLPGAAPADRPIASILTPATNCPTPTVALIAKHSAAKGREAGVLGALSDRADPEKYLDGDG